MNALSAAVEKPLDTQFVIVHTHAKSISVRGNQYSDAASIYGHPVDEVVQAFRHRGIIAVKIEEWGGLIRAVVPNGKGGSTVQFYYVDTLQPVLPPRE